MPYDSMGFTSTLRDASEASATLGDAVFHHADAIQHLAEALEEEVSRYARELASRITLLHDGAGQISSAGMEIARAGDRIASCGEHLALVMQQVVIVIAASMLTVATGLFGWQYFLLGVVCLWLCGFEVRRRQPAPQMQAQQQQTQQGQPHSGGPHLHSALHCPAADGGRPKRVSWEHGIDGSQGTTDSGVPTPHSEQDQSPRVPDGARHQGLDGVYISRGVVPPPSEVTAGDGHRVNSNAALAAGAQAASRDGVATLRSGGVVATRNGDGTAHSIPAGSTPVTLRVAPDSPADAAGAVLGAAGGPSGAPATVLPVGE